MTAIPFVLSHSDLSILAQQEANLIQQLELARKKKNAILNQADSLLAQAALKGIVLFDWQCNPEDCG
jgi:hypothetical protein